MMQYKINKIAIIKTTAIHYIEFGIHIALKEMIGDVVSERMDVNKAKMRSY